MQDGTDGLVAHGDHRGLHTEAGAQLPGSPGQGPSLGQKLGAADVGCQVAVAEVEPGLHAETAEHLQSAEGVTGQTPTSFRVDQPGEGVGHGVEVGGDVEAVEGLVVAGVDHDGQVGGREEPGQSESQLGSADAAGQGQHFAPVPRKRAAGQGRACVPALEARRGCSKR